MDEKPPTRRWYRFSLRTMLVLVALCAMAVVGGRLWYRSLHFAEKGRLHTAAMNSGKNILNDRPSLQGSGRSFANIRHGITYHRRMADQYRRAARYPWLSVDAEPTESHP